MRLGRDLAVHRAGRVRSHIRSGALTPSRPRPFDKHDPRGLDQPEPGAGQIGRRLVTHRQHAAGVVEPVVGAGELLEVARDPMRLAQLGGARDDPRELPERAEQLAFLRLGEQGRVEPSPSPRRDPELARRCAAARRPGRGRTARRTPGCRWSAVAMRSRSRSSVRVGAGPGQRVARRVDADGVDEVVERDERAGPLAHPDRLAVLDEVHELADDHLDGAVRVVAEAGRDRLACRPT